MHYTSSQWCHAGLSPLAAVLIHKHLEQGSGVVSVERLDPTFDFVEDLSGLARALHLPCEAVHPKGMVNPDRAIGEHQDRRRDRCHLRQHRERCAEE